MAKTVDQIVAEQLGGLTLEVARLQARIEALTEENSALKAAQAKASDVDPVH